MAGLVSISTSGQSPTSGFGDAGTRGVSYSVAGGGEGFIRYNWPVDEAQVSFGVWYFSASGLANFQEGPHAVTLGNFGFGNTLRISDERSSFTNARQLRLSPNNEFVLIDDSTWYYLTMKFVQNGTCTLNVYNADKTLHGSITTTDPDNQPARYIALGNTSGTTSVPGVFTYFDNLVVDYTNASFPLLEWNPAGFVPNLSIFAIQ